MNLFHKLYDLECVTFFSELIFLFDVEGQYPYLTEL